MARGAALASTLMGELYQINGCQKSHTTAHHPQGSGTCVHSNQTLLTLLSSLKEMNQIRWSSKLLALFHAHNTTHTMRLALHFVVCGRPFRHPVDWVNDLRTAVQSHMLETRPICYSFRARRVPLLPGQQVFIRDFSRRARGKGTQSM